MKGTQVSQFTVGQRVRYVGGNTGTIVRLHRSTRSGQAEIRPQDGSRKVTRKLQYVQPE